MDASTRPQFSITAHLPSTDQRDRADLQLARAYSLILSWPAQLAGPAQAADVPELTQPQYTEPSLDHTQAS